MKCPQLLLPFFVLMLTPAAAHAISAQIECEATYRAWSLDPKMKDYLRTHTCVLKVACKNSKDQLKSN